MNILEELHVWLEVYALVVPMCVIIYWWKRLPRRHPLVIYIFPAFIVNLIAILLYYNHNAIMKNDSMPFIFKNNNVFYNVHSFFRVVFFTIFLIYLRPPKLSDLYKVIFGLFLLFVIVDFTLFESPLYFSTPLHTAEAFVLMFFSTSYLLSYLQDDTSERTFNQGAVIIWSGIGIYAAITFFIYLFFWIVAKQGDRFLTIMMIIRKFAFATFCALLAYGLYIDARKGIASAKRPRIKPGVSGRKTVENIS